MTRASFGPVIVIRRGSNRLYLYNGVRCPALFGVATGQSAYPTPLGSWQIVVRWRNPWWYPPNSPWAQGEKPIPPGPGNPLGTRWMGLSATRCRHPRDAGRHLDRLLGLARLHPHAHPRRRVALQPRDRRDAGLHRLGVVLLPAMDAGLSPADTTAPETALALAQATGLGGGRVRRLAWCQRPRAAAPSLEEAPMTAGRLKLGAQALAVGARRPAARAARLEARQGQRQGGGRRQGRAELHARADRRAGDAAAGLATRQGRRAQLLGVLVLPVQAGGAPLLGRRQALARACGRAWRRRTTTSPATRASSPASTASTTRSCTTTTTSPRRTYGVTGLPETFFIDRTGKVVVARSGLR